MRTPESIAFAKSIGVSSSVLEEVLDCIGQKTSLQYIRKTLRVMYGVKLSNVQRAAIKQYAAKSK